jgi:hypothetical protein
MKPANRRCALCGKQEQPGQPCVTPVTALLRFWGIQPGPHAHYAHLKCIESRRRRESKEIAHGNP